MEQQVAAKFQALGTSLYISEPRVTSAGNTSAKTGKEGCDHLEIPISLVDVQPEFTLPEMTGKSNKGKDTNRNVTRDHRTWK